MTELSYRNVWRLAGPNVASNILLVSVSFAHLLIIAPFGPEASAAVIAGGRIHFLLMAASMALSVATTALVARAWGAGKTDAASSTTTSSLILATAMAAILGLTAYFTADWSVRLFNLNEATARMAADFVRPAALLNFAFALSLTIYTAFRAIGDTARPMRFTAVATSVGIAMSYALTHGSFGLPNLGISGLAIGSAIGQLLIVVWFLFMWLSGRYVLKPDLANGFDINRFRRLIKIGMPAAMEQLLIQFSFIAFMILVSGFGTSAFAAYGIGITILSVCIVIGMGFGAASATLSGQSFGAANPQAARANGWLATKMAVSCMSLVALLILGFRDILSQSLTADIATQHYTSYFIIILAIIQPLMAIEFTIGSALRGAGETRYPLLVTFTGMGIGRFAIGLSVIALGGSAEALYTIIIADYLIKASMLVTRFRTDAWFPSDEQADEETQDPDSRIPLAVQSVAGIVRAPIRAYIERRRSSNDPPQ